MGHHPTFFGTSLDVALWKAATAVGREPNALQYRAEELDDGQWKVVLVEEPQIEGEPPEPEPLPEGEQGGASDESEERRIEAGPVPAVPDGLEAPALAEAVLTELLERIGTKATLTTEVKDETVRIELEDCDEALLLGREARLLDSLQYLVTRIVQHKERGGPGVFLDVKGRREERARAISDMAVRLADAVRESGKAIRVEAATSADRRLIHNALADRRDVRTGSEGAGAFRCLVVQPAARK